MSRKLSRKLTLNTPVKPESMVTVKINVCGMLFETMETTLSRFPNSLLGNKIEREKYFLPSSNTYYFDRNRQCFEAILFYYQSWGLLIRPPDIPYDLFVEEVSFFGLGNEALLSLRDNEGFTPKDVKLPKRRWQRKIWTLFEFPDTNIGSRIVASLSIAFISLSIVIISMETVPGYQHEESHEKPGAHPNYWFMLELACIVWFTFEYLIRLITSPNKRKFLFSFLNIVDVLAIIPYFVTVSVSMKHSVPFSVLRIVRLVRILRILKLSRHSVGLQVLGYTLKASISELIMLCCFLSIVLILFSSAMFFAEAAHNNMFTSVPDAFWYSIVTVTTLGYGDKYPKTLVGKLVGSACAVMGVLTIALPVPVIVSNFELFSKRVRMNIDKRRKETAKQDEQG